MSPSQFISYLIAIHMITVYPVVCCAAVPSIPRPSDGQFILYAKEGKTDQVAEALLHYPDLVNVQNSVSYL